jgi:hypothetical protein
MALLDNDTETYGGFSYDTVDELFLGLDSLEAQQYAKALDVPDYQRYTQELDSQGYTQALDLPDEQGYLQTDTVEDFINSVLESKGFSGEFDLQGLFDNEKGSLSQTEFKESLAIVEELVGDDVFAIVDQDDLPQNFDANAITQTSEQDPYGLGLETEKSTYTDGDNQYSYAQPYKESASEIAEAIKAKLSAEGVSPELIENLNIIGIIEAVLQESGGQLNPEDLADIIQAIRNQLPLESSDIWRKPEMTDNSGDGQGGGQNGGQGDQQNGDSETPETDSTI